MKATEANLLQVLKNAPQFSIPIYQRNYSWKPEQCQQLWDDLFKVGENKKLTAHFIGPIVYIQGLTNVARQEPLLVIDGQQRLTTCTLLITALANHFERNNTGELLGAFSSRKLRNYYLLNQDEDGERRFKLILSETDKETLLAILQNTPMPKEPSIRIKDNYELFEKLILKNHDHLETICQGLSKLMIVDVSLDRHHDNPQLIFESMNSTGLELSQADLIRNYILMGLESKLQSDLYKTYWRPMEKLFGQDGYTVHFDAFMRHYLTAKTGDIPNVREVYSAFKLYERGINGDTRNLLHDVYVYATYYCAMALGTEKNKKLNQAFHDLRELKVDVAYPFLLDVYADCQQQRLTGEELLAIVRLTESYVFRRAVCDIPTNSLNKIFAGMSRVINKEKYLESVQAFFMLLPSYRRFPSDDEFKFELKKHDLYNFRSCNYWIRRLENHGKKESISVKNYTIEHILPQNEVLSPTWQTDLGADWQQIQQTWLHTLGNLTLTGYNSEYSDHSFAFKRDQIKDMDGQLVGFAHSPLKLNLGLGSIPVWNEDAIKNRAERLATEAVHVWAAPKLAAELLHTYRPSAKKAGQKYSIDDHPKLMTGLIRDLFDALRQAVLALDPCVSEEFQKFYVAYKAETNFMDIEPQIKLKRLRLLLNMPFHEIDDPKSICNDVSGVGHMGNGDVEISFTAVAQLPYVLGLVRQSFERQKFSP